MASGSPCCTFLSMVKPFACVNRRSSVVSITGAAASIGQLIDDKIAIKLLTDTGAQLSAVLDAGKQIAVVAETHSFIAFSDLADITVTVVVVVDGSVRGDDTAKLIISVTISEMTTRG